MTVDKQISRRIQQTLLVFVAVACQFAIEVLYKGVFANSTVLRCSCNNGCIGFGTWEARVSEDVPAVYQPTVVRWSDHFMQAKNPASDVCFPLYHVEQSSNLYRVTTLAALERMELRDIEDDEIFDSAFRRIVVQEDVLRPGGYRLSVDETLTATESTQSFEAICQELYAGTFGDTPGYAPDRELMAIIEALVTIEPYKSPKRSLWSRWLSRHQ